MSCSGNLEYIVELQCGWNFKTHVCSGKSGHLSNREHILGFSSRIGWERGMPLNMRQNQSPFPVATGILGFLSIFKRSQSSSHFEALNSVCLSSCQREVRPPAEMMLGTNAFSRVFTEDSVIPSSWEIQDKPAYMALQGNPALCRVRAPRTPFHLRPQIQGSSHIPRAERSLLLCCFWRVGIPLESKLGNQLSSRVIWGTQTSVVLV